MAGAWITIIGAAITIAINYFLIPYFSYTACAWATFASYGSMMAISYIWGQKEYRIPYAWKKLVAYILIVVVLYFIHQGITALNKNVYLNLISALALTVLYSWFIATVEHKELPKLPFIGRYFKEK